jgi:hypothetical protein
MKLGKIVIAILMVGFFVITSNIKLLLRALGRDHLIVQLLSGITTFQPLIEAAFPNPTFPWSKLIASAAIMCSVVAFIYMNTNSNNKKKNRVKKTTNQKQIGVNKVNSKYKMNSQDRKRKKGKTKSNNAIKTKWQLTHSRTRTRKTKSRSAPTKRNKSR